MISSSDYLFWICILVVVLSYPSNAKKQIHIFWIRVLLSHMARASGICSIVIIIRVRIVVFCWTKNHNKQTFPPHPSRYPARRRNSAVAVSLAWNGRSRLLAKSALTGELVMGLTKVWCFSHSITSSALYTMRCSDVKVTRCWISATGICEIGHMSFKLGITNCIGLERFGISHSDFSVVLGFFSVFFQLWTLCVMIRLCECHPKDGMWSKREQR